MLKRHLCSLVLAAAMCFGTASSCVHRVPLTATQTAQLNSNQAIAAISASARSATDLAINLNAQKLISDDLTRSILDYTDAVGSGVVAAVMVQRSTKTDAEKAQSVLDLLNKIKLPKSVQDFVNAPGASGQVAGLITFLRATISGITALVGGK